MSKRNTPPATLRLARLAAGKTQADLATLIGRHRIFIHRMETGGYARLTPEIAEAIARAVKMPVALLFSDCPVKPSVPATPLREVLSNEGKSRRQFAREIGIGEAHLSSIILGSRVPDAYLAARIAAIVGVPVHHLFPHIRQGAA